MKILVKILRVNMESICPCLRDLISRWMPKKRSIYEPILEIDEEEGLAGKHDEFTVDDSITPQQIVYPAV